MIQPSLQPSLSGMSRSYRLLEALAFAVGASAIPLAIFALLMFLHQWA